MGIPLHLPASMFSKEKAAFVGLGWPKMATSLAASSIDSERDFLKVILDELNCEFTLQLDTEPVLDRLVHTPEVSTSQTVIFAGGSHACRIAEAARSTYPEVVDLSIGGWKLTTESAAELAHDISCVLEDAEDNSFTIVLHLFDNSIYKGLSDGELTDAFKLKGSYHIKGELQLISSTELKSLFETALPIMRACSGSNIILLGPLPRYVNKKCCDEASHITNFGTPEYVASMASSIREMGKQLRNMAHIRRLKNTKVKNPAVLMGVLDSTEISPPPPPSYWSSMALPLSTLLHSDTRQLPPDWRTSFRMRMLSTQDSPPTPPQVAATAA